MIELLSSLLSQAGVARWGLVRCQPVEQWAVDLYDQFLARGRHGSMTFMERYREVRNDPRLLLDSGAVWMVVCAIPYYSSPSNPCFSLHSQGLDYHYVAKERLQPILEAMGTSGRICVDSAPVRERYWAQKAGVGFVGLNNQLIVPGVGSYCFLAEIVLGELEWAREIVRSLPNEPCKGCNRCIKACPHQALEGHGGMDARKCHSFLTIEGKDAEVLSRYSHLPLFGCDACQRVCHYNLNPLPAPWGELRASEASLSLTRQQVLEMDGSRFKSFFRHSPLLRSRLLGRERR